MFPCQTELPGRFQSLLLVFLKTTAGCGPCSYCLISPCVSFICLYSLSCSLSYLLSPSPLPLQINSLAASVTSLSVRVNCFLCFLSFFWGGGGSLHVVCVIESRGLLLLLAAAGLNRVQGARDKDGEPEGDSVFLIASHTNTHMHPHTNTHTGDNTDTNSLTHIDVAEPHVERQEMRRGLVSLLFDPQTCFDERTQCDTHLFKTMTHTQTSKHTQTHIPPTPEPPPHFNLFSKCCFLPCGAEPVFLFMEGC